MVSLHCVSNVPLVYTTNCIFVSHLFYTGILIAFIAHSLKTNIKRIAEMCPWKHPKDDLRDDVMDHLWDDLKSMFVWDDIWDHLCRSFHESSQTQFFGTLRWSQRWSMRWYIQMISENISMFQKIAFEMIHGMICTDIIPNMLLRT